MKIMHGINLCHSERLKFHTECAVAYFYGTDHRVLIQQGGTVLAEHPSCGSTGIQRGCTVHNTKSYLACMQKLDYHME